MKKIVLLFAFISHSYVLANYELDEIFYFPQKGGSVLTLDTSIKSYEIEYGENNVGIAGGDIQEFDQKVLLIRPTYKYSLNDRLLISTALSYQTKDLETNIENAQDVPTKADSKNGIYDPTIGLRYRLLKKNTVYVDVLLTQIFKTNAFIEGNRTRTAQTYSGRNASSLSTVMGYKFRSFMLETHLNINYLTKLERKIVLLDENYKSKNTFSIGFGGRVLFRASEQLNIIGGFRSTSVNAYDMKGSTTSLHIDQVLKAVLSGRLEFKKLQHSIGILSLGLDFDTTFNRFTYDNLDVLKSESQIILSTFRIEKRF